jgi:GntR family transcriptional repressor for pyruvate dehydrogenase complex
MVDTTERAQDDLFAFSLKRDKLHTHITDQIQELIVTQSLRPGDKLPGERELADMLGVSRTVVREAIRVLGVKGLVNVRPGCGTYVQALDHKNASASMELYLKTQQAAVTPEQLCEVRLMIETEAAALAAERATAADRERLQAHIDAMLDNIADPELYVRHDLAFHLALTEATHNALFPVLLPPITDLLTRVMETAMQTPDAAAKGVDEHRHILAQIAAKTASGARRAMHDHLVRVHGLIAQTETLSKPEQGET